MKKFIQLHDILNNIIKVNKIHCITTCDYGKDFHIRVRLKKDELVLSYNDKNIRDNDAVILKHACNQED